MFLFHAQSISQNEITKTQHCNLLYNAKFWCANVFGNGFLNGLSSAKENYQVTKTFGVYYQTQPKVTLVRALLVHIPYFKTLPSSSESTERGYCAPSHLFAPGWTNQTLPPGNLNW